MASQDPYNLVKQELQEMVWSREALEEERRVAVRMFR